MVAARRTWTSTGMAASTEVDQIHWYTIFRRYSSLSCLTWRSRCFTHLVRLSCRLLLLEYRGSIVVHWSATPNFYPDALSFCITDQSAYIAHLFISPHLLTLSRTTLCLMVTSDAHHSSSFSHSHRDPLPAHGKPCSDVAKHCGPTRNVYVPAIRDVRKGILCTLVRPSSPLWHLPPPMPPHSSRSPQTHLAPL